MKRTVLRNIKSDDPGMNAHGDDSDSCGGAKSSGDDSLGARGQMLLKIINDVMDMAHFNLSTDKEAVLANSLRTAMAPALFSIESFVLALDPDHHRLPMTQVVDVDGCVGWVANGATKKWQLYSAMHLSRLQVLY